MALFFTVQQQKEHFLNFSRWKVSLQCHSQLKTLINLSGTPPSEHEAVRRSSCKRVAENEGNNNCVMPDFGFKVAAKMAAMMAVRI